MNYPLAHTPSNYVDTVTRYLPSAFGLRFSRPGLKRGPAPTRPEMDDNRSGLDLFLLRWRSRQQQFGEKQSQDWFASMSRAIQALDAMTTESRQTELDEIVGQLRIKKPSEELLDQTLAHLCVEAELRLGLKPRQNQMLAARLMLRGFSVEMQTGEGKSLAVGLAAGVVALAGTPVHVITANDYLAERDAKCFESFYTSLGLSVDSALGINTEKERRNAYAQNVVYVTGKQVAFDWLNDALSRQTTACSLASRLGELAMPFTQETNAPMLRGLCMAIVDEADSLLIDEARVPLVLASTREVSAQDETEGAIALGLAEQLNDVVHFDIHETARTIELSDEGRDALKRMAASVSHVWQSSRYRDERVIQALTILHLFVKDKDYIVRNEAIELLDANTGRSLPDRRLQFGLHQLLELKEKCTPTPEQTTLASIPFQHFFNRYVDLVGISGTLKDVKNELLQVYGIDVVTVEPHKESQCVHNETLCFTDDEQRLNRLVAEVTQRNTCGQPVLICTRTVDQSKHVSKRLQEAGLDHQVLNAYQDVEEAQIVSEAGRASAITVATSMAGRGTDISLGPGVTDVGGLHVINLSFNDSMRVDKQIFGRAARQGEPGSTQSFVSFDDTFLVSAMPALIRFLCRLSLRVNSQMIVNKLIRFSQQRIENRHRKERLANFKSRKNIDRYLAFGGEQEHMS